MTASIRRDVNFFFLHNSKARVDCSNSRKHTLFFIVFFVRVAAFPASVFFIVLWFESVAGCGFESFIWRFRRSKKNTASDFKNNAWARLQPSFNDERINVTGWTIKNKYLFRFFYWAHSLASVDEKKIVVTTFVKLRSVLLVLVIILRCGY